MTLYKRRIYGADDSVAKKHHRILGRYPSLRDKIPDITAGPYNGYSLSVTGVSYRHKL
jgi:hypothetical protein